MNPLECLKMFTPIQPSSQIIKVPKHTRSRKGYSIRQQSQQPQKYLVDLDLGYCTAKNLRLNHKAVNPKKKKISRQTWVPWR